MYVGLWVNNEVSLSIGLLQAVIELSTLATGTQSLSKEAILILIGSSYTVCGITTKQDPSRRKLVLPVRTEEIVQPSIASAFHERT